MNQSQNQNVSRGLFHSHKIHLFALFYLFTDFLQSEMIDLACKQIVSLSQVFCRFYPTLSSHFNLL